MEPACSNKIRRLAKESVRSGLTDLAEATNFQRKLSSDSMCHEAAQIFTTGESMAELEGEWSLFQALIFKEEDGIQVTRLVDFKQCFRVVDYSVTERDGISFRELEGKGKRFLSGEFSLAKPSHGNERSVRVKHIGPIKDWFLMEFPDGVKIGVSTGGADYFLETPSSAYEELHYKLYEKASVADGVWKLCSAYPKASLSSVCAELSVIDGYEFVVQNLHFIAHHVGNWANADKRGRSVPQALLDLRRMLNSFPEVTGSSKMYYPRSQAKTTPLVEKLFADLFSNRFIGCPDVVEVDKDYDVGSKPRVLTPAEDPNWRDNLVFFEIGETPQWRFQAGSGIRKASSVFVPRVGELKIGDFVVCDLLAKDPAESFRSSDRRKVFDGSSSVLVQIRKFQPDEEEGQLHVIRYFKPVETVIGSSRFANEVFASKICATISLQNVARRAVVTQVKSRGGEEGREVFLCQRLYDPTNCRFVSCDESITTGFTGDSACPGCQSTVSSCVSADGQTLLMNDGERVCVNDVVFLEPPMFFSSSASRRPCGLSADEAHPKSREDFLNDFKDRKRYPEFWRQSPDYQGRGAFRELGEVMELGLVEGFSSSEGPDGGLTWNVALRALVREKDVLLGDQQIPLPNAVYLTSERRVVPISKIIGPVKILCPEYPASQAYGELLKLKDDIVFVLKGQWSEETGFQVLPIADTLRNHLRRVYSHRRDEAKFKITPLKAMDLFAGAGGLSHGLLQSGVIRTCWAVESDPNAARAYKANHPWAEVFRMDVNRFADAVLMNKTIADGIRIPKRGEVEMIIFGPPCQGVSKLNKFCTGEHAMFNNSLFSTALGLIDFYRPMYGVMENVTGLIDASDGKLLQGIHKTLVDLDYQVATSVLQSGSYGLPQSRARLFIVFASPSKTLPSFPKPVTVFSTRASFGMLRIPGLPSTLLALTPSTQWSKSLAGTAPFEAVIVKEAIGDLPRETSCKQVSYSCQPSSWYQVMMRRGRSQVSDHESRYLNSLNVDRAKLIPKFPGADWRNLPNDALDAGYDVLNYKCKRVNGKERWYLCSCQLEPSKYPSECDYGEKKTSTIIPFAVAHTADRNGNWAGVFGRVRWDGYFPSTLTDPFPTKRSGTVLHPEFDRVLSVREYARSQGFPDSYVFCGSVEDRYRQVGNAVPPPLAYQIGRELAKVMVEKQTAVVDISDD